MERSNRKKSTAAGFFLILTAIIISVIFTPSDNAAQVFESVLCVERDSAPETGIASELPDTLIPGGFPFGVKFYTKGVIVVGVSEVESENGFVSPASLAGIRKGDVIICVNGKNIDTVEEIASAVENSDGSEISFEISRNGESFSASLKPEKDNGGKYRSGMWVRDSTAGIGTVTFINPDTLDFGGLGHGICDTDTGCIMPLSRGSVVNVTVTDIVRGVGGHPGELKGSFGADKTGRLTLNSPCGVFGTFFSLPEKSSYSPLPVGHRSEVAEGKAQIYSCVTEDESKIYEIEITKINPDSADGKSFVIKVTDPSLIELTGGIIQGMSGSPIIQNGKIIGAVTHVFINDPTKGYGIFIENMLAEAKK